MDVHLTAQEVWTAADDREGWRAPQSSVDYTRSDDDDDDDDGVESHYLYPTPRLRMLDGVDETCFCFKSCYCFMAVIGIPSQSFGVSLAIWDHTV